MDQAPEEPYDNYLTYIEARPEVMLGKPVIKGTRITVQLILEQLAGGQSISSLLEAYPHLSAQAIRAAIGYAAQLFSYENQSVLAKALLQKATEGHQKEIKPFFELLTRLRPVPAEITAEEVTPEFETLRQRRHIRHHLEDIEARYQVKILVAVETGSRAWGFPSPDSDYDVRLIYIHPPEWYLQLKEHKDTLELMLDERMLDIAGWDLRKTLRLLAKSNPPLLEWMQSPIVYKEIPGFIKELNQLSGSFYSRIATLHHYLSMGKKILDQVQNEPAYKLKSLFYALRAALTCRWILEKSEKPPIAFSRLLSGLSLPDPLRLHIDRLVQLKGLKQETYRHSGEQEVISLIRKTLNAAEEQAANLPAARGRIQQLDQFFIQTLDSVWK